MRKIKVAILGATGMVGRFLIEILSNHPWFEIGVLAASFRSCGKKLKEVIGNKKIGNKNSVPDYILEKVILDAENDVEKIVKIVDCVFCAVDISKEYVKRLEYMYAGLDCPVISNNSANRWVEDIPIIIPEINYNHLEIIKYQKMRLGTKRGFIVTKPNCSIQTFVPVLHPLRFLGLKHIIVCTYQSISGTGKELIDFPEIKDNIIPFIKDEELKTEKEPLKIWGEIENGKIISSKSPVISSHCSRVPVSHGHMATVFVKFENKTNRDEILNAWNNFDTSRFDELPSKPKSTIVYRNEEDRPQTNIDRNTSNGMAITVGRLRKDPIFDFKFVCLSHNVLRGAAGGSVLLAELLAQKGYI